MTDLKVKFENLKSCLLSYGKVAVAFSAGVDSTFLLKTAHDLLGNNAIAITVDHIAFQKRELDEAEEFCKSENIELIKIPFDVTSVEGFINNPPDRCYICKKALFQKIIQTAEERGIANVVEGSNLDDSGDYRPGKKAIAELGVKSPLLTAGLTKQDIRTLSKESGLKTYDKPSYACLATRIPYGEKITKEKLSMIENAEQILFDLGFRQSRVRHHGNLARIEIEPSDFERFMRPEIRDKVLQKIKSIGFLYVSLDLGGYKTGSMNAAIK